MPKLNKMLAAWIITTLQEAIQHYLLSFKKTKLFSHQLNSKNIYRPRIVILDKIIGIESVSCSHLLQQMAKIGKD